MKNLAIMAGSNTIYDDNDIG